MKININNVEINNFPKESLKVDAFWVDLYENDLPKRPNKKKRQRNRI